MLYTSVILLHLLILQLSVQTVWLKQEFGRRCYFPDQSGNFQFGHEVGHTVFALMVEGAPSESVICTTPSTNPANTTQLTSYVADTLTSSLRVRDIPEFAHETIV